MRISVSKNSEVPLRQQLAEQIIFLITTGQLHPGEQMPSVRALAQRARVHHNTVSEAYQDLVSRGWLTRQRGSRLVVGVREAPRQNPRLSLDELINETILRAKEMGYSLKALTACVRERLAAQPPDHILIVEQETGLREIIQHEVREQLGLPVAGCSLEEFTQDPALAVGAQVFAPQHFIAELKSLVPRERPVIAITYSAADQHVRLVQNLKEPSIVAVISVSQSLLKTARGLFAPVVGRRHTFKEYLARGGEIDLGGVDLAFCDSLVIREVKSRRKIRYNLVAPDCLEHLATAAGLAAMR
jgi:GntR family transcriptional regulator